MGSHSPFVVLGPVSVQGRISKSLPLKGSVMRTAFLVLTVTVVFVVGGAGTATAQASLHFKCEDEQDPFRTYCTTINTFLDDAAASRNAAGKIDRSNPQVRTDLATFVNVYSDHPSFTALLANSIAFRDALNAAANSVPAFPTDSPFTRAAISGVNQAR